MQGHARVKWSAVELKSPRFSPLKSLKGHKPTKATVSMATAALRWRMSPSWRQLQPPGSLRGQLKKKCFRLFFPSYTLKTLSNKEDILQQIQMYLLKKALVMIEHRKPLGWPAKAQTSTQCASSAELWSSQLEALHRNHMRKIMLPTIPCINVFGDVRSWFSFLFLLLCWPTIIAVRVSQAWEVKIYEALCLAPWGRPFTWGLWERMEGILPKGGKGWERKIQREPLWSRARWVQCVKFSPDFRKGGCSLLCQSCSHDHKPGSEKNTLEMHLAFKLFLFLSPWTETAVKTQPHLSVPAHTVSQAGQLIHVLFLPLFCWVPL